jgi:hypothetical protein
LASPAFVLVHVNVADLKPSLVDWRKQDLLKKQEGPDRDNSEQSEPEGKGGIENIRVAAL